MDCVFLDVGNVILSDDPSVAFYYSELSEFICERVDPSFTYQRFILEREELVRGGSTTPGADIARRHLSDDQWRLFQKQHQANLAPRYDALTPELPGIRDTIARLDGRVKLGIIANQPVACVASLKRRGLWDAFSVHAISDVLGISKPDPALFRWACEQAGVPPERCLMVGDRLDNDVLP
ncbi:MAG: HAD family hydrolase, partial [Chloroflexota bacterium]|nr:HAD family hydrolase [Chloroflexota bacterium]